MKLIRSCMPLFSSNNRTKNIPLPWHGVRPHPGSDPSNTSVPMFYCQHPATGRKISRFTNSKGISVFPSRLYDGYKAFLDGRLCREKKRYEDLAESGQHPEIMVIGCGDSRVAPEIIFDAGPGEIFVIRNIANLVPPCEPDTQTSFHGTSAAIEFAVNALKVKHIVVLGHASC